MSIKTSALSSGQRLPQPPEIKLSVTQRNLRQIACFRSRVVDYYSVIHLKYGTTTLQPYHHMPVRVSLPGLSICLHPTLHRVARALHYHPPVARDSCTVRSDHNKCNLFHTLSWFVFDMETLRFRSLSPETCTTC